MSRWKCPRHPTTFCTCPRPVTLDEIGQSNDPLRTLQSEMQKEIARGHTYLYNQPCATCGDLDGCWFAPERLETRLRAVHRSMLEADIEAPDFGSREDIRFLALALCGEAGEYANEVKKEWRGSPVADEKELDELADAYNYLLLSALVRGLSETGLKRYAARKLVAYIEKRREEGVEVSWT